MTRRGDGRKRQAEMQYSKNSLCQTVVDTCQFDFDSQLSVYGGVKRPSEPLSRQDLYVGLMTTFGSRSGGTAQTAAGRP